MDSTKLIRTVTPTPDSRLSTEQRPAHAGARVTGARPMSFASSLPSRFRPRGLHPRPRRPPDFPRSHRPPWQPESRNAPATNVQLEPLVFEPFPPMRFPGGPAGIVQQPKCARARGPPPGKIRDKNQFPSPSPPRAPAFPRLRPASTGRPGAGQSLPRDHAFIRIFVRFYGLPGSTPVPPNEAERRIPPTPPVGFRKILEHFSRSRTIID